MKKNVKGLAIFLGIISVLFIWFDQHRSFFKATNGEYITMWKRWGGTCYLIPGRYYGIIKPNDCYIETENKNECVNFLWPDKSNYLLYYGNVDDKIYNMEKTHFIISNYLNSKQKNDSLFTEKKGYYSHYKNIVRLNLNILEGYATDETGKTQR